MEGLSSSRPEQRPAFVLMVSLNLSECHLSIESSFHGGGHGGPEKHGDLAQGHRAASARAGVRTQLICLPLPWLLPRGHPFSNWGAEGVCRRQELHERQPRMSK